MSLFTTSNTFNHKLSVINLSSYIYTGDLLLLTVKMDSDDENLVIPHGAHAVPPRDPALAGAVMPSELGYETEWDAFQLSIARYSGLVFF